MTIDDTAPTVLPIPPKAAPALTGEAPARWRSVTLRFARRHLKIPLVPYGYDDAEWETTKVALRGLLVARARARSVVPYSQLVAELGPITFSPDAFPFHRMLDEVSAKEDAAGRGLLTVVVVHKLGDMRPGPGFFDLASSRGRDVTDIDKTWLAELDRVWAYWRDH